MIEMIKMINPMDYQNGGRWPLRQYINDRNDKSEGGDTLYADYLYMCVFVCFYSISVSVLASPRFYHFYHFYHGINGLPDNGPMIKMIEMIEMIKPWGSQNGALKHPVSLPRVK